jgi:hypothetical protein
MWTMLVLWDTFFSPLPVSTAIMLAAYLALAVVTTTTARGGFPEAKTVAQAGA